MQSRRGKSPTESPARREEAKDPYEGDDDKYQEHFRKTFITENQRMVDEDALEEAFTVHDMLIPSGRTAKLVRIPDITDEDLRISEVCDRLKFVDPTPVIVLAGCMTERAGKTLAGVARAASRTDAVIIDSGIGSGIEKFCLRRKLTVIGVAPENEVKYPRITPVGRRELELTNGHSHFVLIGDNVQEAEEAGQIPTRYFWGDEAKIKMDLALRIAQGRTKKAKTIACKVVMVVVGDNSLCHKEVELAASRGVQIVVLRGTPFSESCAKGKEAHPKLPPTQNADGTKLSGARRQ